MSKYKYRSLVLRSKLRNPNKNFHRLRDLHGLFKKYPELEEKYLNAIRLPITGKESIDLPFYFKDHRNNSCLDISPYGNQQISKNTCTICTQQYIPTAADSIVGYIEQTGNMMKYQSLYLCIQKNRALFRLYIQTPHIFQITYILQGTNEECFPVLTISEEKLHVYIIFNKQNIHLPCDCIASLMRVSDNCELSLHIYNDVVVLRGTTISNENVPIPIDHEILQHKIEEMDISDNVKEKYEKYKVLLGNGISV